MSSRLPSSLNVAATTARAWRNCFSSRPVATSQILALPSSSPAVTTCEPSGLSEADLSSVAVEKAASERLEGTSHTETAPSSVQTTRRRPFASKFAPCPRPPRCQVATGSARVRSQRVTAVTGCFLVSSTLTETTCAASGLGTATTGSPFSSPRTNEPAGGHVARSERRLASAVTTFVGRRG